MSTRLRVALILGLPTTVILSVTIMPLMWMWMIPAAIGGTELAPLFLLVGLVVIGLAWRRDPAQRILRWWALGCGSCLVLLSGRTVVSLPQTWATADAAMIAGLQAAGHPASEPGKYPVLDPLTLLIGLRTPNITVDVGVELGTSGDVLLRGDVYHPPHAGLHPVVLMIHGGGWSSGDRSEGHRLSCALAAANFLVISADYRLAPAHQFPAQLADVQVAMRWIRKNAAGLGGDPTRIAVMGRSAGAQLALLTAATADSGIAAVIGFYSPVDFVAGWRDPGWPDPLDARNVFRSYLGGTLDELPERYREASPINHTHHPLPPVLLIYGGSDQLIELRFGQLLTKQLRAGGTSTVLITIPWAEHAFDAIPHGLGGQLALHHVERFLTATLQR